MGHATVDSHVFDLLIVGAGPIGLLSALGAYARGCRNIAIIDQTRAFRMAGEYLDLQPNGMMALRLVAPKAADAVRAQAAPSSEKAPLLLDVDGTLVDEYKAQGAGKESTASISWWNLQKALLDVMPKDVQITINLQLLNLEFVVVKGRDGEDEELVRADCVENRIRVNPFVNWGNDPAAAGEGTNEFANDSVARPKSLFAKIVIGADGINSVCRAVVYRNIGGLEWESAAKAEYSGFMQFQGMGSLGEENAVLGTELDNYLQNSFFAGICCREEDCKLESPKSILCHVPDEMRAKVNHEWIFTLQFAAEERLAKRDPDAGGHTALHAHALETMRNVHYPQSLQKLADILLAKEDEKHIAIARPLYVVPVDHPTPFERQPTASEALTVPENFFRPFGYKRVFLAGDSLHGGPPFLAQGTSMGFEDCCELVDVLAKAHGWDSGNACYPGQEILNEALTKYRSARIERVAAVQRWTLNKIPGHKVDERAAIWKEVSNFVPVADGW